MRSTILQLTPQHFQLTVFCRFPTIRGGAPSAPLPLLFGSCDWSHLIDLLEHAKASRRLPQASRTLAASRSRGFKTRPFLTFPRSGFKPERISGPQNREETKWAHRQVAKSFQTEPRLRHSLKHKPNKTTSRVPSPISHYSLILRSSAAY